MVVERKTKKQPPTGRTMKFVSHLQNQQRDTEQKKKERKKQQRPLLSHCLPRIVGKFEFPVEIGRDSNASSITPTLSAPRPQYHKHFFFMHVHLQLRYVDQIYTIHRQPQQWPCYRAHCHIFVESPLRDPSNFSSTRIVCLNGFT